MPGAQIDTTGLLNLPVATSLAGTEWVPLAQGGTTRRATTDQIASLGSSGSIVVTGSLYVNVKDYGATGDGVTDDYASIMDAVEACKAQGTTVEGYKGATLFFPPGAYKVTGEIADGGAADGVTSIMILGNGLHNTHVFGSVVGYIFLKEEGDSFDKGFGGISGLHVSNSRDTAGSGAVSAANTINFYVRDCFLQGFTALDLATGTFDCVVDNCQFLGSGTIGTIGISAGQVYVYGCSVAGFDTGIQWGTTGGGGAGGCSMTSNRVEVCNTGILVGVAPNGDPSGCSVGIHDTTTERCDVSVDIQGGNLVVISNMKATGSVGPQSTGSGTWSGGVVTVTSAIPLADKPGPDGPWTTGTRVVTIDNASDSGYNVNEVTATWTGTSTFTYPLGFAGPTCNVLSWSFEQTAGLRNHGADNLTVISSVFHTLIDLTVCDGQAYFVNTRCNSGTWDLPTTFNRSNLVIGPNCDAPANTLLCAALPGQPGVARQPVFGDVYVVTDGGQGAGVPAGWGDTVVADFLSGQTLQVMWSGSVWKAVALLS